MNQQLFEKYLSNQVSYYEKYGQFPLRKGVQPPHPTLFTVSKDENTKGDTGKSMKNALQVLWYAKRHLLGAKVTLNSEKIKPVGLL